MRAELGKLSLAKVGESPKELFTCDQRENGIAQEFQLFVVASPGTILGRLHGLKLARLGAVRQRLIDEFGVLKVISQLSFQCGDFSRFHVE